MMRSKLLVFGMIAATALAACQDMDPVGPSAIEDGSAVSPAGAPVIVSSVTIVEFPGSNSGISGLATLTRTKDGLSVDQSFSGLTAGKAYTIWWAIFDNPRGCDGPCDPSDLSRRQAQPSLVNGGGFMATGTSASYSSEMARHDVGGSQVWVGDASGVDNPYGAEVHLVLRDHGVAETDPGDLALQTSTFQEKCNLPDGPDPGTETDCANATAAVFARPDAPGQGS